METLFIFILSVLATYRLALMFAKEEGPCRIFERIRAIPEPGGCWHKGISCILCESVWWAGLITLWLLFAGYVPWQLCVVYWLGTSALAILVNEFGPNLD